MKKADQPLNIDVEKQQLVIRIGVDTLAFAFENGDIANPFIDALNDFTRAYKVTNSKQFAHDVVDELTKEEEDGSNLITRLLDRVCLDAVENGSAAIKYLLEEEN